MVEKADTPDSDAPFNRQGPSVAQIRTRVAGLVVLVCKVFAIVLVLGALLVLLGKSVNADNGVVRFVWDFAELVDGPLSKDGGIFAFTGENAVKLNALTNWGLAAVVWLVVGSLLGKLIRP